ncbi:MAG: IPTL-CTERM sorting domain-containing protein [Acidobacteriota bacterium]
MKRFLGIVGFAVVCVLLVSSPPALASTDPPACQGGYVGPCCPPLVDWDGDGPCADDTAITLTYFNGNSGRLGTPWDTCFGGQTPRWWNLEDFDPVRGKYGNINRYGMPGKQVIILGDLVTPTVGNPFPVSCVFREEHWGSGPVVSGTGTLVDADGDGLYDYGIGDGNGHHVELGFIADDPTNPHYMSFNWIYASMFGVRFGDGCPAGGGEDPQVWVPITGTLATGLRIIPDLYQCPNGPEAQLWGSAPLAMGFEPQQEAIPLLSEWGLGTLGLGMVFVGWWIVRQRISLG